MEPPAAPGRQKSLDQLLEQAIAERCREEDQVEVTYEMAGGFVDGQQQAMRLQPSERRDGEEGNGDTMGSVQTEKKVMRNTITLSVSMIFILSGFSTLQSLQSSLFPETGLQSLSVVYVCTFSSFLYAPTLVQKLGIKSTIASMSIADLLYIVAFCFHRPYLLIASAALLGFSSGPIIYAQMTYLFNNISRISFVTHAMRDKIQQRYLKFFFVISKSNVFWSHLATAVVTSAMNSELATQSDFLNSTLYDDDDTKSWRTSTTCPELSCSSRPDEFDFPALKVSETNIVPTFTLKILMYIFTCCILVGVLVIVCFVEQLDILQQQDPLERPLIYLTLRQIRLVLVDKHIRLALPLIIFIGIEQAYIFGDFTKSFVSCSLGLQSVVLTMVCEGAANTLGCVGVHLFQQHIQRPLIMAGGIVCQAGLLTVLWLWTPLKDDAAVFYVIAGGWGLCHAIWETLTTTYLASTYAEDWPIPFCAYYQLQCIGSAAVFAISPYLCSEIKVCVLAAALALALVPYTALEFRIHQRSRTQTNTTAL